MTALGRIGGKPLVEELRGGRYGDEGVLTLEGCLKAVTVI
jgi:hypothetical protein